MRREAPTNLDDPENEEVRILKVSMLRAIAGVVSEQTTANPELGRPEADLNEAAGAAADGPFVDTSG